MVALRHLASVNEWTDRQTATYAEGAFMLHEVRSAGYAWTLDLAWLASDECPLSHDEAEEAISKVLSSRA